MEQTEAQRQSRNKYFRRKILMSSFSSTLCIALVLYMSGLFFMLLFNTQHISDMFRSNIKLTITLNDNKSLAEIENFRKSIDASPFARESLYISKDQATEELKEDLGEDFVEILDGKNPLLSRIEVKLIDSYSNIDSINSLTKYLKTLSVVDEVDYPKNVLRNTTTVLSKLATIIFTLAIILTIVTVIILTNSVKLQMTSNRFDIRTAKLIGASNWHISKPYLVKSLIQGGIAILLSAIGLTLTIKYIEKIVSGVVLISAFPITLLVMATIGLLVTLITTLICTHKYINADEDELYF
ncbi:MAG: permease-like cell division protein FtsX [Bacteroidales bacterium]|nr:permease-like cell division protein FtsX [Bacteroidales bacterium]